MQNKNEILKYIPPILAFFLGPASLPIFCTSCLQQHREIGNGSCGQLIHFLYPSLLLRERNPHTLPQLHWGVPPMGDCAPQTSAV